MPIYFYSASEEYAGFSNFSDHPFKLDGATWPTVEHFFQAQKFPGSPHADAIRRARSPTQAKSLGRSRKFPLRPDWESVKDDVMRRAVLKKFQTHADLRAQLLATGDAELVEKAPRDYYWGCGASGKGQNRLGQILMEVRQILREREKEGQDDEADPG